MLDLKEWIIKVSNWINTPSIPKDTHLTIGTGHIRQEEWSDVDNFYYDTPGYHAFYAGGSGRFYIYDDNVYSNVPLKVPSVTIGSHSSPIGTIKNEWLSSDKSVASGTASALCSISLEAGTWIINCGVRFPTNATGWRRANFTTTSGATDYHVNVTATSGGVTQLNFTRIETVTSTTTYYLNAYHNAGSALTMPTGGSNWGNYIRAIRIA